MWCVFKCVIHFRDILSWRRKVRACFMRKYGRETPRRLILADVNVVSSQQVNAGSSNT